jgi:hypothetical protein
VGKKGMPKRKTTPTGVPFAATAWFFRIASGLMVLFALDLVRGLFRSQFPSVEAGVTRGIMDSTRFPVLGSICSWGRFYVGFGLLTATYMFLTAFLSWNLGRLAGEKDEAVRPLAWALFIAQAAVVLLSFICFYAGPIFFSVLIALFLGLAAKGISSR